MRSEMRRKLEARGIKLYTTHLPSVGRNIQKIRLPPKLPEVPTQTYKGWMNIFIGNDGTVYPGKLHAERKDCDHALVKVCGTRIACIYVEIKDGEGLG